MVRDAVFCGCLLCTESLGVGHLRNHNQCRIVELLLPARISFSWKSKGNTYRVPLWAKHLQQKLTFHQTRGSRNLRNKPHRHAESWVIEYSVKIRRLNQILFILMDFASRWCCRCRDALEGLPKSFAGWGGAVGAGVGCCPIMSFFLHVPVEHASFDAFNQCLSLWFILV